MWAVSVTRYKNNESLFLPDCCETKTLLHRNQISTAVVCFLHLEIFLSLPSLFAEVFTHIPESCSFLLPCIFPSPGLCCDDILLLYLHNDFSCSSNAWVWVCVYLLCVCVYVRVGLYVFVCFYLSICVFLSAWVGGFLSGLRCMESHFQANDSVKESLQLAVVQLIADVRAGNIANSQGARSVCLMLAGIGQDLYEQTIEVSWNTIGERFSPGKSTFGTPGWNCSPAVVPLASSPLQQQPHLTTKYQQHADPSFGGNFLRV